MSQKLIFVSSPYSHKDPEIVKRRVDQVCKFCAKKIAEGFIFFSPIAYGHLMLSYCPMPSDWEFWKNYCEGFLSKCDEMIVLMLPGWQVSIGVQEEIEFATKKNIPISYILI